MGVPYTFASATNSIPLSQLDANFNTPVTIGSTTVGLGNTTTTLAGLANVSTTLLVATTANVTTQNVTTSNLTNLTVTNDASISGLTVGKGGGAQGSNTAFGYQAINGTNSGSGQNTGIGYQSLFTNTTGNGLTGIGSQSLYSNTTGNGNIGIGGSTPFVTNAALYSNTTGNYNTASGSGALTGNTTGSSNVAHGFQSLASNTTASNNTAVGYQAGYTNSTATGQTFIGYQAGYTSNGNYNTCIGEAAGYSLTTGVGNCFVSSGYSAAGYTVTTGSYNTVLGGFNGNQGGLNISTSSNYIVLSDGAGNPRGIFDNNGSFLVNSPISAPTSGSATFGGQVYIGSRYYNFTSSDYVLTVAYGTTVTQGISFGTNATSGTQTACRFIQNNGVVGYIQTTNTNTSFVTSSDYRLKENIAPMTGALDTVAKLKPVTYKWKFDGSDGQGFIAHELQSVIPDCVTGEKDAVNEDGTPIYQGVDTSFLVATLTAAIQEQQALITDLQARLTKAGL